MAGSNMHGPIICVAIWYCAAVHRAFARNALGDLTSHLAVNAQPPRDPRPGSGRSITTAFTARVGLPRLRVVLAPTANGCQCGRHRTVNWRNCTACRQKTPSERPRVRSPSRTARTHACVRAGRWPRIGPPRRRPNGTYGTAMGPPPVSGTLMTFATPNVTVLGAAALDLAITGRPHPLDANSTSACAS